MSTIEDKIRGLVRGLINEEDEFEFAEGKNELLVLLDVYTSTKHDLRIHYEPEVETVLHRDSIFDKKIEERIRDGKEFVKEKAREKNVAMVKKALIKVLELEQVWDNRRWGKRGIFYTQIIGDKII